MAGSLLGGEISRPDDPRDKDNVSLSDLTAVGDPYEMDVRMTGAEVQATRSESTILDRGALATQAVGPCVCPACGTPLSNIHCLRRHERNRIQFEES
jgi:hypothetical protein